MTTTAPPAQPGPLSSDHINYLILRYLQEAGHEASATAFYRDWRRPAEYRDPEDLPFAPNVARHELVSVIQDGLQHDELVSRVRKEGRRFMFTTNGGGVGSRPGTAGNGKGKARLEQVRRGGEGMEDFPTPPPKRQRRSEESPRERQVNGAGAVEPMEVETAASPSVGDAEDDVEGASPAVQSPEPEVIEVPERYDSMDVAVQTEGIAKTGPKTSTMYWQINSGKADATILHNAFSPQHASRSMFTAGEGIVRFYDVPAHLEGEVVKIASLEDELTGTGSVVTACAWHPQGHALAFAVDLVRDIGVGGKQERRQVINCHDARSSRTREFKSPPLLEPAGIVLALRYSWDGSQLLAVRTNGSRGTVEIWDAQAQESNGFGHGPDIKAWSIFEDRILDAAWIGPTEFAVCGDGGFLQKFKLASDRSNGLSPEETYTSDSAQMRGLAKSTTLCTFDARQHLSFDKVCVTPEVSSVTNPEGLFVAVASQDRTLVMAFAVSDVSRDISASLQDERITALAFRPSSNQTETHVGPSERTLALAYEGGQVAIHQLFSSSKAQVEVMCQLGGGSPALALAWSPEGSYLAVAGTDIVQIWNSKILARRAEGEQNDDVRAPDALVTWRREKSRRRNGEHAVNGEGEEPLLEPSLSWSADGGSLALAVGKEVAVIRFRPPLRDGREGAAAEVNGHGS